MEATEPAVQIDDARQDARLRPRRTHGDAARRGALSRRDAEFRRHRGRHFPAGGGGRRRRQGHDPGRHDGAVRDRRSVRHAQLSRACRSANSRSGPARSWRPPIISPSISKASAAMRRVRICPSTRCWSARQIVNQLQSIVSRNVDPLHSAVISICMFHAGNADNVIPQTAQLNGTARSLTPEVQRSAGTAHPGGGRRRRAAARRQGERRAIGAAIRCCATTNGRPALRRRWPDRSSARTRSTPRWRR